MTAKRFTRDNHTGYLYDNGEIVEDIMELLNALNDENEQLKQSFNEVLKDLEVTTFDKELLEKENEQLQQDKDNLIDFIKKEFPKSHKHILEGFE